MTRRTSSETPPSHDPLHVQQQQQQGLQQLGEHAHSHPHHHNHQHSNDTAPLHSAVHSHHHHDSTEGATATATEAADRPNKNGMNAEEEESLKAIVKDLEEFEFSVGVSEDRNKRCRRSMEDTHAFIYNYEGITGHGFFAIFDGHAGKAAADWCGQHFHEVLGRILEEKGDLPETDFQDIVNEAFLEADQQLAEALKQGRSSGCTAIVAYIRKEGDKRVLYTGNVGDARAVLCHGNKAIRLSYDHKGSDHTEAQRILDVGGFVMNNRVNGVLSVTRALGDSSMKEFVIGSPYTTRTELGADCPYLILACDGLWDVCSDQEAVELIQEVTDPNKASRLLLDHALQKFSTDNISVMVVRLGLDQ